LLIRHSKYSAILSKIHSYTDCFFGEFANWAISISISTYTEYPKIKLKMVVNL